MAAPPADSRAARLEARLRPPVIAAALAVLPLLALSLSEPHGAWHTVEVLGHWTVWGIFFAEVAVMLAVVADRRAWLDGHRFEVLVVVVSSPLLPLALAVAPALRLLIVAKAFKTLKLAKAIKLAKLGKSTRVVWRRVRLERAAAAGLVAVAVVLAGATLVDMLTDRSPLQGGGDTLALVLAGALATLALERRRRERAREDLNL